MRDEDDRAARLFQSADDVKQALDFVGAQGCGGLVEDDEIGLERQGLGDFDELPLRDGKISHFGVERDRAVLPEVGQDFVGTAAHRGKRKPSGATEFRQEDIFHDREIRRQTRLLHHHGDAGIKRLARRFEVEGAPFIQDRSAVPAHVTGDDPR